MHQYGVMHTDDVYYNFDLSDDKCAQFSEPDYEVASYMASFFVNFARTGNPNINNSQVMVFCFQNCSDLLWERIVLSSYREKLLKFEAEGREFAKFLRSLEKFTQTVKGQTIFWNRMLFQFVPGGFLALI